MMPAVMLSTTYKDIVLRHMSLSRSPPIGCEGRLGQMVWLSRRLDSLMSEIWYIWRVSHFLDSTRPCLMAPSGSKRPPDLIKQIDFQAYRHGCRKFRLSMAKEVHGSMQAPLRERIHLCSFCHAGPRVFHLRLSRFLNMSLMNRQSM